MLAASYETRLREAAEAIDFPLTEAQIAGMAAHQALLSRWAQKFNLTAVTDPSQAAVLHGLDSALFSRLLPESFADPKAPVVDVGSGAGFPGLVLAILRPDQAFVLLEPIRKRASFLRVAAAELGLRQVSVLEGKLSLDPKDAGPTAKLWKQAGAWVSRATLPPLRLLELAGSTLASGASVVLSVGRDGLGEAELLEAGQAHGLERVAHARFELPGGHLRELSRWQPLLA